MALAPGPWSFVKVYRTIQDKNGQAIATVDVGQEDNGVLAALAPDLYLSLKDMFFAYLNKGEDFPHSFELEAKEEAMRLIRSVEGEHWNFEKKGGNGNV